MRWTILASLILWIASCGQKGPLYLPEQKALTGAPVYALTINQLSCGHVQA